MNAAAKSIASKPLTPELISSIRGTWAGMDLSDHRYLDDEEQGFRSACLEISRMLDRGASTIGEIQSIYSHEYMDIYDLRYEEDWVRGTYSAYQAMERIFEKA